MTVVIPCAGTGSRLGSETKFINKSMVTIAERPAFSYIIDNFTKEDEIIILLGYKGEYVRSAIEACYPNHNIKFIYVDKFEGEGSGLGYSLLQARNLLQKPFVFWACDTIPDIRVSKLGDELKNASKYDSNTLLTSALSPKDIGLYRAVKETNLWSGNYELVDKSEVTLDTIDQYYTYMGVAYIHDYNDFWKYADSDITKFIDMGESFPLSLMKFKSVYVMPTRWYDVGSITGLNNARTHLKSQMSNKVIMPKPKESIWFMNGEVIKFHIDSEFIEKRVQRASKLLSPGMIKNNIKYPIIIRHNKYTYCYKEVEGKVLSDNLLPVIFRKLIDSYFINGIDRKEVSKESKEKFIDEFYINKTNKRIRDYLDNHKWYHIINGKSCIDPIVNLDSLDKDIFINNIIPTDYCHGDFHLENILFNETTQSFIMLDWRQGFVSDLWWGDVCYDLAKMLHSLIVNHKYVRNGDFKFVIKSNDSCEIDIRQSEIYSQCRSILMNTCQKMNINYSFIELMTAIIFLNIASCHDGDGVYPEFLFHLGAYLLGNYVEENNVK